MASEFFDVAAEVGSEEEEEDYDRENGEDRPRKGGDKAMADSSEEEEDDEDEEEAARIREGFIVDEEEEEEERARRRAKRKRPRSERADGLELLDEEDLDLVAEAHGGFEQRTAAKPKFKRLKQGHADRSAPEHRDLADIFNDEEVEEETRPRGRFQGLPEDLDDFIEDDELDEEEREALREELEVRKPGAPRGLAGIGAIEQSGLDEAALEDLRMAFGDGTEYDWALEIQDQIDEEEQGLGEELTLKDVFEPSQLVERMLTDEDNEIRNTDVPERFQLARKSFKPLDLSPEQMAQRSSEEAVWVTGMMFPKKRLERALLEPFQQAVAKVLQFFNVDEFEVPFIFQHRKDYVIHATEHMVNGKKEINADRLLDQGDLWQIFDLDLRYRGMAEKRDSVRKSYESIKPILPQPDKVLEELLPVAINMEDVQDLQDYLHFRYAAELKDVHAADAGTNGTQKRARASRSTWERVRASRVYQLVRAFGLSADQLAKSALNPGQREYTEDASSRPDDMADGLLDSPDFPTGSVVLKAAKAMFAEEIFVSPRMRKYVRKSFYEEGILDCFRTERGARQITEDHRYFEFKYLRNQDFTAIARRPELYLRMLKAEAEGLVEVKISLQSKRRFSENLYRLIESDSLSSVADAWNEARRDVVDLALQKLEQNIAKSVKETLKVECENELGRTIREKYYTKLDQAPYRPKGMVKGTEPRVLALTNGHGGRDAIVWTYVDEDGRVLEHGKFVDLRAGNPEKDIPDGKDVERFLELVNRRQPDVIGVGGFSVEARKLYKEVQDIVDRQDLRSSEFEDEDGNFKTDRLEVMIVNDETARLYHTSDQATADYPGFAPLAKYCVGLSRYLQNPLLEYAALGKHITSISFEANQDLLPKDKLLRYLESSMVDLVNLVGVEANMAMSDSRIANLLPYISGLGPRKAAQMVKAININGSVVHTRDELLGDPDKKLIQAVGPQVWKNCASFLYITYDSTETDSDYLDNTRVHPEDYYLAQKMAADALELDEEDIKAEVDESGPGAVIRKLIKEEAQEKVNDLVLEEYAEQLATKFNQRKRATLENIREELQAPFEELRKPLIILTHEEIFSILSGETKESLIEDMIISVSIWKVFSNHIEVRLDNGMDGTISEGEFPDGVGGERGLDPRDVFARNQTIQAKLLHLNKRQLHATLSLNERALKRGYRKELDHNPGEWDFVQHNEDVSDEKKAKEQKAGRAQRVIKHPNFRPFNSAQAEEYLGSQSRGDVVIRPSSLGTDHLAVTWKISDTIYQHIDVVELSKDNDFSVGKKLVVGKYTYSDLDDLIANHVNAMAKKVEEMVNDEKYQARSKAATDEWLNTYSKANPRRSNYAFCINPKYPGYFFLSFKPGQNAEICSWPVKVTPVAFELQKNQYPDMRALKNGFKVLFQNQNLTVRGGPPPRR
ncbi:transcription elongation factor spt6 [Eremomyces bilateralis CBS 781.70]|uniref:Transcription elongation factor Spt6 n=1 Tax=Eremomyces bilateralis CBS 781.70 TaxID=1392243 RepID=A0A6G1G1U7_9PEZI|nr:transcription elongation factor spt6 [Eremomyces bilateralis CBS 781.70]KAF1811900.1 transcription elongation factor spt6 [Eremomyces bilateralis CBS 781.70]